MSHDAGFWLKPSRDVAPSAIVRALRSFGWSVDDGGRISHLREGARDPSKWTDSEISDEPAVLALLDRNLSAGSPAGIALLLERRGVEIIFERDRPVLLSLSIDRLALDGSSFTDVSWYLLRILKPLAKAGIAVSAVSFSETE